MTPDIVVIFPPECRSNIHRNQRGNGGRGCLPFPDTGYYLEPMKLILWVSLAAFLEIGTAWGQAPPTSFSFTWESGEHSMDMSIDRAIWWLDGTALRFKEEQIGRNKGVPASKSPFRDKVGLGKSQLAKLTSVLEGLVNEDSVSLLPENYQGTLTEYTLNFGNPPHVVLFAASQQDVNEIEKENSPGTVKPSKPARGNILYIKMNALLDYLVELSRQP